MMRIRPILKRFTRKKIKKDKEIHRAANRKKVSIKSRFMTKLGFIKDKQKADNESDEYNREYATADLLVTTDEPGYVTVHVSADNTESASEKNTTEKLEPRESIGNALREESVKDTKPLGEKHTTDKLTPVEIPENELHINSTEDLKDNLLLRVPDRSVYKDLQRRSLDQLISDRSSGISRDSSLWSRKQFGYNRTASNVSIYSKQQHERADTRTVWTQTDISNTETVEKLVGPSPAESLDVKLEDIEPGPSPSGSTGFGVEPRFCFKQVENPKLAKIKNQILKRLTCPNLQTCEASICIELLKFPKLPFLIALNRKLSQEDALFNVEFLELNGLDYLLLLMDYIAEEGLADLVDVCHMVIVSECATSVVNSKAGREYLITHGEHIVSMARALETKNLMVKMQIFELLSALCVYSKDGYYLTLDALERYRSWQKLQYRMSLLVNELRKSELTTYRTTIMALINAIIFANENIRDRVRIRNEFISLNILDTIQTLRADDDDELNVQCDVFEEELNADSEAVENMNEGRVNVNDHLSVFSAILKRVQGTPLNATFLGILHTLLQIEPYSSHSESIWTLIERIAQEAIIKDPHEEGDQLIEKCKDQTKKQKDEGTQTDEVARTGSGILRRSLVNKSPAPRTSSGTFDQSSGSVPPPPPPIPTIQIGSQPPPPPPPPLFKQHSVPAPPPPPPSPGSKRMSANVLLPAGVPPAPPSPGGSVPPPPPPPPSPGMAPPPPPPPGSPVPPPPPGGMMSPSVQQGPPPPKAIETPDPGCKMKTINWNKIPAYAFKQDSVWSDVLKMNDSIDVEYGRLEELFSQKVTSPTAGTLSPEAEDNNKVMTRKNSNKDIEVTLLDPKKSMNVNIFLKQFRKANDVIVDLIKQGDARALGVEKLKGLLKLLPAQEEIEIIQGYEGDVDKLGNAEKFFHGLIQLKSYKFRIETMLLKADFNSQIGAVRPNIQVYNSVCRKLIDNKSLKSFLRFVLHAGNFLNKGSSAGNAIGFRISSLNKLVMTKSNVPRMTLLHHLVEEAEKKQKDSLAFVEDLLDLLQKASRFTLEGMLTEFNSLKTNVQRLKTQLEHVDQEVKDQFSSFMEEAENDIGDVEEAIGRVQKLSVRLANHYCENENSFKIDEFLEAFKEFCEKCKSCQQDLETWRINEEKAEQRRKTQAELAEKRRSGHGTLGLKVQEDRKIVDNLVNEIRKGKVLRRLSMRHKSQESKT